MAMIESGPAMAYTPIAGLSCTPHSTRFRLSDMAALADETMRNRRRYSFVPGMALALVKDGEVHVNGYGRVDRQAKTPIDPKATLFRMASLSKLFTATAVMQLVEQGKLDLHADVNDYLPDQFIPATFEQSVTLQHLLTHTAGFEINSFGYSISELELGQQNLLQALRRHRPARIRPPTRAFDNGRHAAYSNWGIALAGGIVSQVSGQDFPDYLEQHVLKPLDMPHSSFHEPLPSELADKLSPGYSGEDDYKKLELQPAGMLAPAGSLCATVADMANFMLMHLQHGRFRDRQILQPESVELMQGRRFSPHPHVNGGGLVWFEQHINGRRLLWHNGLAPHFYCEIFLLPEENLGVLSACNAEPSAKFSGELIRTLMDEFYPARLPPFEAFAKNHGTAKACGGHYIHSAHSRTTWEKALIPLQCTAIRSPAPGRLQIADSSQESGTSAWAESEAQPGVFRRLDREDTIAVTRDDTGRHWIVGLAPFAPMRQLSFTERPLPNLALLLLCAAALINAAWRQPELPTVLDRLAASVAAVDIAALTLLVLVAIQVRDVYRVLRRLPWTLYAALGLGMASLVVTPVFGIALIADWGSPHVSATQALAYSAELLAAAAFLGWMHYWNLLGVRLARRLRSE